MSDGTKIQWTDASWTPIRARRKDGQPNKGDGGWACQRVSPGCQNCYAATINKRLGTGFDYDAKGIAASDIYLDEKTLTQPLRWRRLRKVFVCSMTDLFGEWVPFEMIDRVFAVMALSPQHTYQVLTKRPERMREYVSNPVTPKRVDLITACMDEGRPTPSNQEHADFQAWVTADPTYSPTWPVPNVWLGVSAEDQEQADERIPVLLDTPAAVRFVSAEPLLGSVDLMRISTGAMTETDALLGWLTTYHDYKPAPGQPPMGSENCEAKSNPEHRISWVIVGGESGPGARPCDVEWIRSIVRQCQAAGVAVFVKQLGARPCVGSVETAAGSNVFVPDLVRLKDRKGGDMSEFPEDLRVREMPR